MLNVTEQLDEFADETGMLRALNELGGEGWLIVRGSFRDQCQQYTSTDMDWSVVCKMLLVREEECDES